MENKYRNVMDYVKELVKTGKLSRGKRAPSIRSICKINNCSISTAVRAYDELQKEHVLYSIQRSGYYVVDKNICNIKKDDSIQNNPYFCTFNNDYPENDDSIIDFSSTSPDIRASKLPLRELKHSINNAVMNYSNNLLSYPSVTGIYELRKNIQKVLQNQQIFVNTDCIFLTSGTQQALYLLSKMPFPNGRQSVLVEQPTYFGMLKALELNNVTAVGITRTKNGIDLDELERIFRSRDIKFFYLIPRFHNPTGFSYTTEEKKQILNLADKYDIYLVEDDYLGDLEPNTKCDPMFAQCTSNRVIYLKSFSKILMPGLRISAAVIPPLLVNMFKEYKACCDIGPTILSQGILEVFIKSGMYTEHIKKIKHLYKEKMMHLGETCNSVLPRDYKVVVPRTGLFACIELPDNVNATFLSNLLQLKGVYTTCIGEAYLPEYRRDNILRLSTCRVNKEEISKGIGIIADAVKFGADNNSLNFRFNHENNYPIRM